MGWDEVTTGGNLRLTLGGGQSNAKKSARASWLCYFSSISTICPSTVPSLVNVCVTLESTFTFSDVCNASRVTEKACRFNHFSTSYLIINPSMASVRMTGEITTVFPVLK